MAKDTALPHEGLWISPDGEEIHVIEHLIEIQHHPERFGIPRRDVKGITIKGLRDIAVGLIKAGWVRFRYLGETWNFEVDSVRLRAGMIEKVLVDANAYELEDVIVSQVNPKKEFRGTVAQMYDRTMFDHYGLGGRNSWRLS